MKIPEKRKKSSKKIIIVCILILAIASGAIVAFLHAKTNLFGNNPDNNKTLNINTVDYNPATNDQTKNGTDIKAGSGSTDKPVAPTVVEGSTKKQVDLIIINASTTKVNVQINAVVDSGTCTLTLTSPGQTTITQTSNIQPLASFSACKTFSYSELPSGNWTIKVDYSNDTLIGTVTDTRSL